MPRTCLNCGQAITCGCQDRKAKDGKACCSKCVDSYNAKLANPPKGNLDYNNVNPHPNTAPEMKSIDVKFNNYNT